MQFQPTAALVLLLSCTVEAQLSYTTNSDGTLSVSDFTGSNSVQIPSSFDGRTVTAIANLAFSESPVTAVAIPSTVSSIGPQAFLFSADLTNITVSSSNLAYANVGPVMFNRSLSTLAAFPGGLVGSYTIPNSVKSVGSFAFAGSQLNSILIPSSVTTFGEQAFWDCGNLRAVTVPGSVTSFGDFVFWSCANLTNVVLADGLKTIGNDAFLQCLNLQSIDFGHTVTNIGASAFQFCGSLGSVILPSSVANIGSGALADCLSLSNVFFLGNAPRTDSSAFGDDPDLPAAYYLPGATGWSKFTAIPVGAWNAAIQADNVNFGARNGVFGFDVTGSTNIPVVVEASVSPAGSWNALTNGSLTGGTLHVQDVGWTNYSARFYRVRSP